MQFGNLGKPKRNAKNETVAPEAQKDLESAPQSWISVESAGSPAIAVEDPLEGLELPDQVAATEHSLSEPCRRSSPRIRAPFKVLHLLPGPRERYEVLEMTLILRREKPQLGDCLLYDVSDGGIGIISSVEMEPGETVTLCGHHQSDPSPVFATEITVLNKRSFQTEQTLPANFQDRHLNTYGLRLDASALAVLTEATDHSLELARARS